MAPWGEGMTATGPKECPNGRRCAMAIDPDMVSETIRCGAIQKSVQAKAKGHLHDIWQAETKAEANIAFGFFIATYSLTTSN